VTLDCLRPHRKSNTNEIASYGSAHDWANVLNLTAHAEILQKTLNEEKHADELLSTISQRANTTAAASA
jgi:ferritin-like metal-binding protein YciE